MNVLCSVYVETNKNLYFSFKKNPRFLLDCAVLVIIFCLFVYCFLPDFQENYNAENCQFGATNTTLRSLGEGRSATPGYLGGSGEESYMTGTTEGSSGVVVTECLRETSLLYLLLTLGTAWLGLSLYNFTKTYVILVCEVFHQWETENHTILTIKERQ